MYIVKKDIIDGTLGGLEKGQELEQSERAKELFDLGYLKEVKKTNKSSGKKVKS
jgi:hypothetical protein